MYAIAEVILKQVPKYVDDCQAFLNCDDEYEFLKAFALRVDARAIVDEFLKG